MTNELKTIDFHGDKIETFEAGGDRWVAMRRICENLGMAWQRQAAKLEAQKEKFNCHLMGTVAEDGKTREMVAIPTRKLALWLACINPNKVAAHVRPKLERYQEECADALNDYWTKGHASRDGFDAERAFKLFERAMERMERLEARLDEADAARAVERERAQVEDKFREDRRRSAVNRQSVYDVLANVPRKGRGKLIPSARRGLIEEAGSDIEYEAPRSNGFEEPLFSRQTIDAWLRREGHRMIADHLGKRPFCRRRRDGQGVLHLVKPGAK